MQTCQLVTVLLTLGLACNLGCSHDSTADRLATLRAHIHQEGSGSEALELFPDLVQVYTDDGHGNPNFAAEVLPYEYYWSAEGKLTVSISAIDTTVFICPYRVDRLITPDDFPMCDVYSGYVEAELGESP
jgi:hypothetical protein